MASMLSGTLKFYQNKSLLTVVSRVVEFYYFSHLCYGIVRAKSFFSVTTYSSRPMSTLHHLLNFNRFRPFSTFSSHLNTVLPKPSPSNRLNIQYFLYGLSSQSLNMSHIHIRSGLSQGSHCSIKGIFQESKFAVGQATLTRKETTRNQRERQEKGCSATWIITVSFLCEKT